SRTSFESSTARIVLHSLETGTNQTLIQNAAAAQYVKTGHLVYLRSGTLMAVPFDLGKLAITGSPVSLIENVMQAVNMPNTGGETTSGQFAISETGTLVYLVGGANPLPENSLVWVERSGGLDPVNLPSVRFVLSPRLS